MDAVSAAPRLRLDLAYDGTFFHGWAAQDGLRTVEGELSAALATVLREPARLTVAGRTDAGVHAAHQVAHLDVSEEAWARLAPRHGEDTALWRGRALVRRVNTLLSRAAAPLIGGARGTCDVVLHGARVVSPSFDARFSALGRRYCYRIADGAAELDPLRRADVWWSGEDVLDVEVMDEAARALLGEHDFLSFCRPREGATTIRTLTRLEVEREVGGLITIRVEADAFCHSMVRSLVGALQPVGARRREITWPAELLAARSRRSAAPIAPPQGLTLEGVDYPEEGLWAERARLARRRRDEGGCCGDGPGPR